MAHFTDAYRDLISRKLSDLGFATELEMMEAIEKFAITFANPLLATDVYKMGHMEQYAPGVTKVVSYLMARSDKNYSYTVFFGLQHYLKTYLSRRITPAMGRQFLENKNAILGLAKAIGGTKNEAENKIMALCNLGYIPIEIKAVREGEVAPVKHAIMTITNTLPDFYWCVGFFESLILKIWDAISTASCSFQYRRLVDKYFDLTVDTEQDFLRQFTVHDFGYRGCPSEEPAVITGAAHLLSFTGSDTVPAREYLVRMYKADPKSLIMASVPASEHSVMCSFGRSDELAAFRNMLRIYPEGLVSIVSDTYNVWTVLTDFASQLKEEILARNGKVVFRPDSGNPEYIICGNPDAPVGSPEWKGAIRLLDEMFGSTVNSKGFKTLNPKVGLIYGDGMYLARYERTLQRLMEMGYATSNLVIGVGGILRNHSRDSLGFALKAIYVEINGEPVEIEKDPVTDPGKRSHKGLVGLFIGEDGEYETRDQLSAEEESLSLLVPVFRNGTTLIEYTHAEIRERVATGLSRYKLTA